MTTFTKSINKTINRATKASALKAMAKHEEKMKAKGWTVTAEFGGSAGCHYELITEFSK